MASLSHSRLAALTSAVLPGPAALVAAALLAAQPLSAQETVYMAVLNSHAHRLNAADNPLVGLFVSTDRGATWTHRGWREYIRTFYAEAGTDGTVWSACGNGVLRSTDQGASWKVTTGWEMTEVLKARPDPADPATVYAATAYGFFKSTDAGATWAKKMQGVARTFTSDVWVDRTDSRHLLLAGEQGVYRSTDGGEQWRPAGLRGKEVTFISQDPRSGRIFWAGTQRDGLFRSADGGRTWEQRIQGLAHRTVYAAAFDPRDSLVVFAGTHDGGVYASVDGGRSWKQRGTGITAPVHALVVLPSDPNIVFAGTLNGGLFRSTDRGNTWEFNSQAEGQVYGLSVR